VTKLNKLLQQPVVRFLLTTKEPWAICWIAALAVVAGIRKAVVADIRKAVVAGIRKAVVADIRKAIVAGVDTDNIVEEEAAFAVVWASLMEFHNYHKTLTQKQLGRHI
jgi:hypothetical protein